MESPSLLELRCPDYPIHRSTLKTLTWTTQYQPEPAERDRSAASVGSEHQKPLAQSAKADHSQSFLSERWTDPAEHHNTPSGAGSVRSEPWKRTPKTPRAKRESLSSSELPQRAQDRSRGAPQHAQRNGIGPQQALEANTKNPRAKRESLSSSELPQRAQDRSRGAHNTPSGAGSVRSEPWKRTPKTPRAKRESLSSSELPQRAEDRSRGAPIRPAERDRSAASIEGDHQNPSRKARKPHAPPSLPASEGPIPRSISTLAQGQRQPLTPRAPCQISASL